MGKNKLDQVGVQVPFKNCPDLGYPSAFIQAALDKPSGKVETNDVSCGGVALQRVDCLTSGWVVSGDYCNCVGGLGIFQVFAGGEKPCLPKDLSKHLQRQHYEVRKVRAKEHLKAHLEKMCGPAVVCCGPTFNAHWVTVLGMHGDK